MPHPPPPPSAHWPSPARFSTLEPSEPSFSSCRSLFRWDYSSRVHPAQANPQGAQVPRATPITHPQDPTNACQGSHSGALSGPIDPFRVMPKRSPAPTAAIPAPPILPLDAGLSLASRSLPSAGRSPLYNTGISLAVSPVAILDIWKT